MQPVILKYGPDRVSPAWDCVAAVWHVFLMLANPFHSVTARQVKLCLCVAPTYVLNLMRIDCYCLQEGTPFKPATLLSNLLSICGK